MRDVRTLPIRPLGVGLTLAALAALIGLACGHGAGLGGSPAHAASGGGDPSPQPVLGTADRQTVIMGAATETGEAGESWAYRVLPGDDPPPEDPRAPFAPVPTGAGGGAGQLVFERATDADPNWSIYETPLDLEGQPYRGMQPDRLSARITPHGGGLLVGQDATRENGKRLVVLARDPGGRFRVLPAPPSGPEGLAGGAEPESLATEEGAGAVADAAVDGAGGHTEAFFGVQGPAREAAVLHWDGEKWTREEVQIPATYKESFRIVAVAGSGPANMWLLAQSAEGGAGVLLFERRLDEESGGFVWAPTKLGAVIPKGLSKGPEFEAANAAAGVSGVAPLGGQAQPLTVTANGVWIDGNLGAPNGGPDGFDFTLYYDIGAHHLTGSWCDAEDSEGGAVCDFALEARFGRLTGYRSFAFAPSASEAAEHPYGGRIVTNPLEPGGDDSTNLGTYLRLEGTTFKRMPGAGPDDSPGGAFQSPSEGWLEGPVQITADPMPQHLAGWPVSARAPFTAIAPAPGSTPGAPNAQALAVGADGVVARYTPGQGWQREFLLTGSGAVSSPNLRAVAWPEPNRAYAVGDLGAMWLWRAETGLWEKDPAAPPAGTQADLLGIAFDPNDPEVGYAVGLGGVLWHYDKTWTQEPLPEPFQADSEGPPFKQVKADFTAVSFAGSEAMVVAEHALLVNDGSGWHVEPEVARLLQSLPEEAKLLTVSGLPNGGAVLAGRDVVIERDSSGSPWHFSSQPIVDETAVAAAPYEEGSHVRALLSVVPEFVYPPPLLFPLEDPNVPPPIIPPTPLPGDGYLLRETPAGWEDEERTDYAGDTADKPIKSDPILALDTGPEGAGWAVGGWSGYADNAGRGTDATGGGQTVRESVETAGVYRYAPAGSPPGPPAAARSKIPMQGGVATFAVAGHADCVTACASLAFDGIAPDRNLGAALSAIGELGAQPNGPRMLLYTGGRETPGQGPESVTEANRYDELLGQSGGLPVYPALSAGDSEGDTVRAFGSAFDSFLGPFGEGQAPPGVTPIEVPGGAASVPGLARTHYAFDSTGPHGEGKVMVVVIDNSRGALEEETEKEEREGAIHPFPYENPPEPQKPWLERVLANARSEGIPAIVMGSRELNPSLPPALNVASDAAEEARIIAEGGASAYLYERPEETRLSQIPVGGARTIPELGTGALGYRSSVADSFTPGQPDELFGTTGYLLLSVDTSERNPKTNVAPVTPRLIPLIQDISLDPVDGTLLRRSAPALFEGLGRRPIAGDHWGPISAADESPNPPGADPYSVFPPELCLQSDCSSRVEPEYTFTSSEPEIANFVEHDPESTNLRKPLQNAEGHVIPDAQSGILCAFNAGTTVVTVSAGGLSYSVPVTVLGGSVQQPCGTVPLAASRFKHQQNQASSTPPPPPTSTPATQPSPVAPVPPPPAAPVAAPVPKATPRPAPPPPAALISPPPPVVAALIVTPPPPVSSFARPTPPGGATVRVFEEEREEEEATESSQAFARYEPAAHIGINGQSGGGPLAPMMLGAAILAAACGASVGLGRRRRGRGVWGRARSGRRAPALAVEAHPYRQFGQGTQLPRQPASSYGDLRRRT